MMTNALEAASIQEITVFEAYCNICDDRVSEYPLPSPEDAQKRFMQHWQYTHEEDGSWRITCDKCGGRAKSGHGGGIECVDPACGWWFCY
jgi:hypothetical protein